MIHLDSGANTVRLVLNDRKTLTTPSYVFVFVNDNTGEKFMCYASDTTVQDYLSEFTITVQASPNWLSGQVALSKMGDYKYYVFEIADISMVVYNTVIAMTIEEMEDSVFDSLVSEGKMNLTPTDLTINTYVNAASSVKAYGD